MPLKVSDGIGAYIDDFQKSDAPQFKGKSKKERRDMAVAAYLTAKRGGLPQKENVRSADKKPEVYIGPDGKPKIRMVPTDREVIKPEAYTMGKPVEKKKMRAESIKVGSTVKPTKGPHAGHPHEVIHDFGDGHYNIKPKNMSPSRNKYRMGATKANIKDLKKESVDELSMYTSKKLPNLSYPKKKTKHEKERDRLAMMKKNKQKGESVNEISDKLKTKYRNKALDTERLKKAQLKSIATSDYIGATDKEKQRASKRADSIMKSLRVYSRPKGESVKEDMNFSVSIEGLPTMFMSADSPGMLKQTLRKIVKQPSMIKAVKRVTDATVKKTFRLKAQGRDEKEMEENYKYDYGSPESIRLMKKITPGQNMKDQPREKLRARLAAVGKQMGQTASKIDQTIGNTPEKKMKKPADSVFKSHPKYEEKDPRLAAAGVKGYNKAKRTPNHPEKSHIVVAKDGDKVKTIRFGQQGVTTAGAPKKGESDKQKARRKNFKARHAKNIAKGKMSAAYWADKVKW